MIVSYIQLQFKKNHDLILKSEFQKTSLSVQIYLTLIEIDTNRNSLLLLSRSLNNMIPKFGLYRLRRNLSLF